MRDNTANLREVIVKKDFELKALETKQQLTRTAGDE
jgi:hypothetical protein